MPMYHFHVRDDIRGNLPDCIGTELPDVAAVEREAMRFAGMTISDYAVHGHPAREWCLEVTDPVGAALFSLEFTARAASAAHAPLRSTTQPSHRVAQ